MTKGCNKCMWFGICPFERPCDHYTPLNAEELMDARAEARRRADFYEQWPEYASSYDDGDMGYFFTPKIRLTLTINTER